MTWKGGIEVRIIGKTLQEELKEIVGEGTVTGSSPKLVYSGCPDRGI
jgi:hypothetical protein